MTLYQNNCKNIRLKILLKYSKNASHPFFLHCAQCFTHPSPFTILFPSSVFSFSLLNIFIIFPLQCFFIPPLHLHLLIYSIYFSIHKYIDLLATLHPPHLDPSSTPHGPHIDPASTPHRPQIEPTSTTHRPYIDPTSTPHRPYIQLF